MGTSHVTAGLLVPATTGVTLTTFVQKLSNTLVKVQSNKNYFKIYLFLLLLWFLYVHLIRLAGLTLQLWSMKTDVTKVNQSFLLRNTQLGSQTVQLWEDWLQENRGCLVESRTAGSRCFHDVSSHFPCSKIRCGSFQGYSEALTTPFQKISTNYSQNYTVICMWVIGANQHICYSEDFSMKENSWLLLF